MGEVGERDAASFRAPSDCAAWAGLPASADLAECCGLRSRACQRWRCAWLQWLRRPRPEPRVGAAGAARRWGSGGGCRACGSGCGRGARCSPCSAASCCCACSGARPPHPLAAGNPPAALWWPRVPYTPPRTPLCAPGAPVADPLDWGAQTFGGCEDEPKGGSGLSVGCAEEVQVSGLDESGGPEGRHLNPVGREGPACVVRAQACGARGGGAAGRDLPSGSASCPGLSTPARAFPRSRPESVQTPGFEGRSGSQGAQGRPGRAAGLPTTALREV